MQSMAATQSNLEVSSAQPSAPMFLNDFREVRSNPVDGKIQAQDFFVYRPPLHVSEIRGCTIFDTCAIVNTPDVMDLSVRNHILVMIPFPVLKELDKLNKYNDNELLRARARIAMRRLRQLFSSRYVELEDSSDSRHDVDGILASNNDERILRCAYRIQTALPPDCRHADKVLFVTDDCNLLLKAAAHSVKCMSSENYCKLMDQSRIPEDPEEPMDVDPTPEQTANQGNSSEPSHSQNNEPKPSQLSRETESKTHAKNRVTISPVAHTLANPPGESIIKDSLQLSTKKIEKSVESSRSLKEEHSSALLDIQNRNYKEAKRSQYYVASVPDRATAREHRPKEKSQSQSGLDLRQEQGVRKPYEKSYLGGESPSRATAASRHFEEASRNRHSIYSSKALSRQPQSPCRSPRFEYNRYYTYSGHDELESQVCSQCKRRYPTKSTPERKDIAAPPYRKRKRGKKRSSNKDPRCETDCSRVQPARDTPVKSPSTSARHDELLLIEQRENTSTKRSQSASELALMEFSEIWNGLAAKVFEKLDQGNPSQKARTDIGKLRDCARRLYESGDIRHLKEFVAMTTTLYYYYTFDPALKNLEFGSTILSGMLSLMLNQSSATATELVNSILHFITDSRVLSC